METLTTRNGTHPGVSFARRFAWVDYPEPEPEEEPAPVVAADEDGIRPPPPDDDAPPVARWRPNPDYRGFRVLVLANPVGQDEVDEQEARQAVWKGDATEADYLRAIAWRVKGWNALSADEDGTIVPIPAPGEAPDNWQAFYAVPKDLMAWVCATVRTAGYPKAARTTPRSRPASTPAAPPPPAPTDG